MSKKAFTITEIMVALTITGFVMVGFFSVVLQVMKSSMITTNRAAQIVDIRTVVDRFYQQARSVSEVITADSEKFKFKRLNMNGDTETWTYAWDGKFFTIQKAGESSTEPLEGVEDVEFKYFQHRNQPTENYTLANAVQITLTVKRGNEMDKNKEVVVQTPLIAFRNHKLLGSSE